MDDITRRGKVERRKGSPRDDGIKFSEKSFRGMREHENVSFHEKWKKRARVSRCKNCYSRIKERGLNDR